jgi:WhiB family transcriptional regulator, redox-sensing transcriptional regulator
MTRGVGVPNAGPVSLWELLELGDRAETAWMDEALCAQIDHDDHFPEKGGSSRVGKRVCAACPVRPQCLAYAVAHREGHGVWGGLSPEERERLSRTADSGVAA